MAGIITTGNFPKTLWPGIKAIWGRSYDEHPKEYTDIFDVQSSDKAYEEDVGATGFGLASIKTEGQSTSYDSESQAYVSRYTHVAYSLGYVVTQEEQDDNLYAEVAQRRTEALAFSMRQTCETVAANVLNRATTAGYTGGDGVVLLSASHPTLNGNQSNIIGTAADLSEAALEDIIIQVMNAKNDRGLKIALTPQKLIVPPALAFESHRILKSELQSNSAQNDINAVRSMGLLPQGVVVNHYLTDTDAWFVKTDCPRGMIMYERTPAKFAQDQDFDTSNAKYKAYHRYSVGWTDWRGVYGSMGA